MDKSLFSVSIKGVFQYNHKYLLRKNQRHEYELLGGRLEKTDSSLLHRLRVEFLEESQILITDIMPREPWLYVCGLNNVIILPYTCKAYKNKIPQIIYDTDGGELQWFNFEDLNSIPLPAGYRNTISDTIPKKTFSPYVGKYPKIIPGYKEALFKVQINLYDVYHSKIFSEYLNHFCSPRDLISEKLESQYNSDDIVSISPSYNNGVINLNYVYIGYKVVYKY